MYRVRKKRFRDGYWVQKMHNFLFLKYWTNEINCMGERAANYICSGLNNDILEYGNGEISYKKDKERKRL